MTYLGLVWALTAAGTARTASAEDVAGGVKPGWIALVIVLALGAAVTFLYFSMRKQLGRIDFPEDQAGDSPNGTADPSDGDRST